MFSIMFTVVFLFVIGTFIIILVSNIKEWNDNNHSPRLIVDVQVVAKRIDVSHHQHPVGGDASGAHGFHTTSSTSYYVTFQVESGDRMELRVDGDEYGMMVEGDRGRLTFQGTRLLEFERES